MKKLALLTFLFALTSNSIIAQSLSIETKGIVDFRLTSTSSSDSYIKGGLGKFRYSDGTRFSIGHAGLETNVEITDHWSARVVGNGYLDGEDDAIGLTEAFFKYQGLPSESGYRLSSRIGVFYPAISLEHIATGWASKDTLTGSTLNTWIGEEVRVAGLEGKLTKLGKFAGKSYDWSVTATVFKNNDPTGALLAWHGWTQSVRQTLYHESRPFPPRLSPELVDQASESDPFRDVDGNPGFHIGGEWKKRRKGSFSFGYYDNQAKPFLIEQGNYGWKTRFYHLGGRWRFDHNLELTWQYLHGDTLMQNLQRQDIVNAGYGSGYIMLSKRWQKKHRFSVRLEEFSVDDRDSTELDNNDEYGKAATFSYQYRLSKGWFLSTEYNWIDSWRPSRSYINLPVDTTERQLQLSARYFFSL